LVKNLNFGQKFKFWVTIEILVKPRKIRRSKNDCRKKVSRTDNYIHFFNIRYNNNIQIIHRTAEVWAIFFIFSDVVFLTYDYCRICAHACPPKIAELRSIWYNKNTLYSGDNNNDAVFSIIMNLFDTMPTRNLFSTGN